MLVYQTTKSRNVNACDRTTVPDNPIKSIIYGGIIYKKNKEFIKKDLDKNIKDNKY